MLSAICRLQSWKWIGAVLAVAAAGAATAAPDITDRLQNLGIPLIDRYPDGKITQSTYARNVWDMKLHAGRVFIGSGNSANTGPSPNAGPAQVWEIDPATGTSQLSYQIGGEQADVFRVFSDGCLYVPDHDPPGTSDYNCYYKRNLSGGWNNGGWVQDEVHVYDMAEFDGKMFACGYYLWRSDDGGATWYRHGTHAGRNYAFLPYGDQLMTSTSYYNWNSGDVFRYWNKATQTWAVPDPISAARAFPDQSNLPGNYLKLVRPAQFGNKCLYIGAYEFNDHQNDPFGAYVSTFNGITFSATAIPAATGEVPWDILVKDGTAYLLVQDRTLLANTDRRYVNRVFASTDAASWTELFSFRATTFAISFEKVGDTFYFGMGTKDRVCDECGTIYRVNPTAGPVIVNFPTLTQSVSEGAGQTTVTVQLSTAAAEDVTVPLTLGGTAISGVDYSSVPTTVVIPAGSTTATFDIALVDDALFEVAETLILTMGAPTHAIAGSASKLTITIADNDGANKPAVRFASESQDAVAGSTASLVASLTKVSGAATTIGLLFEGTATNNLDYTVDKTSVTIPAGATEATVSFTLLERAAGKTVIASIKYWPSNADMGAPRIHTMTVAASEAPPPALPTAAFASAAQTVQENAGTVSISVVLSQASSSAVSIPFTLGGTAQAGADYQSPASPLTIPAGQTSGSIAIALTDDGLAEPAETIIVTLGTPTGATLGATTTHTLTVAASEAPPPALPTAAFASAAQTVQENAGTVSISVVLSQASSSAVSIPFTLGGTAQAGADYQSPASPLTIPAGQTSGSIAIALTDDGLAEPAETIIVTLGTPTGATLGATTTHTLTIAASEAAPQADYNAIPYRESFEGARWNDRPLPAALAPAPGWRVPSPCGAVVAATGRYAYTGRRPISGAHENILQLDPAGAAITNRLDPAHDLSASVLHVDAMVSFEAAGEASPLGGADGAPKIAVYANNRGRLCILHGCLDAQGGRSGVVETETNAAVPTNGWCRVSVAFDATVEPGGTLPEVEMFCVRIDGEIVRSPAAYSASWSTDWRAGNLPRPSPGGVWFPSADKSAQSRALGGLVLKGSGKIDDLCVVEEDPFLGMGERALLLLR